jgi:hypothetical protein
MNKKILASVMAFSLLIPNTVFADTVSYNEAIQGVTISGDSVVEEPIINVDVPTSDDIVINPYMIAFEADKDTVSANGKHNAIVSNPHTLTNNGNTPIAVSIEAFKVSGGDDVDEEKGAFPVTVIAGSAAKAKAKSINIYAAFAMSTTDTAITKADLETYAYGNLDAAKKKLVKKVVATQDKKFTKKTSGGTTTYDTADLDGATGKAVVTIEPTKEAYYQILGDVNPNPSYTKKEGTKTVTVNDPWTQADQDAVKVSYKLKLEPQQNTYTN